MRVEQTQLCLSRRQQQGLASRTIRLQVRKGVAIFIIYNFAVIRDNSYQQANHRDITHTMILGRIKSALYYGETRYRYQYLLLICLYIRQHIGGFQ